MAKSTPVRLTEMKKAIHQAGGVLGISGMPHTASVTL